MAKITLVRFNVIESKTKELFKKTEQDLDYHKIIKLNQFVKYLVKDLFGSSITEKALSQYVNKQMLEKINFCVSVYLSNVKCNTEAKNKICEQQMQDELIAVIHNYETTFKTLAKEIQAYAAYNAIEIDDEDSMDLAMLLTRQCPGAFTYTNKVEFTLPDYQFAEWILIHTEIA